MKKDLIKTKKQLSIELDELRSESKAREEQLKAINQQLQASEQQLRASNQQLDANNQQLLATEQQLRTTNQQLHERIKELNCLYDISEIVDIPDISFEEILKRVIDIIPNSWQYPEITTCQIVLDHKKFETAGFIQTDWCQSSHIIVNGKHAGEINICYREKKPDSDEGPFLLEERLLLNAIAERLGRIIQHNRANKKLLKSEEKFRLLFTEMAEGVYLHEMIYNPKNEAIDYRIIEANRASEKHLKIKPEKAVGQLATQLYGTHQAPFIDLYAKVVKTGIPIQFESYFSPLKKHFQISVHSPDKGLFATVFSDITERKQAELKIKEKDLHLESIINNPVDYVIYRLQAGPDPMSPVVTHVSPSITDLTGVPFAESKIYSNWFKNVHPDDLPHLIQANAKGMRPPFLFDEEFRYKHPTKGLIWFQARSNGIPDKNNPDRIEWAHGILVNITDRKRAEEKLIAANQQLYASEQQLRATNQQLNASNQQLIKSKHALNKEKIFSEKILETASACIIGLDHNRRIRIFNRGAESISGFKKEEVIEQDWIELFFSGKIRSEMHEKWKQTWGTKSSSYINPIQTKSGEERIISWQITGIYNSSDPAKHLLLFIGEDITKRKKALEALKKSEEKFKSYIENAPDGIFIANEKGKYIEVNKAASKITGYSEKELKELTIPDLTQKRYRNKAQHHFQNVVSKGFANAELGYAMKSGENRFWTVDAVKLSDTRFLGFAKDVTKRKKTEEELLISEQKYRNHANFLNIVIENSPFAMWISDAEGTLIRANQALRNILNVTDDMVVGKYNVLEDKNLHEQGLMPGILSVYKDLKTYRFKTRWKGSKAGNIDLSTTVADEFWLDVSLFPITDETDQLTHVICQYVDITKMKKTEKALQKSEEKFRYVLSNSVMTIYNLNLSTGTFDYLSPAANEMYGLSPDELISSGIKGLINRYHPDDYEKQKNHIENLLLNKIKDFTPTIEYRFNHPQFGYRWISDTRTIIFNKKGEPKAVIGNAYDITKRKETEEREKAIEEKMSSIFRVAPTGIGVTKDRTLIEVNPRICEMTGYSKAELLGKNARMLYPTQAEYEFVGTDKYRQIKEKGTGTVETLWQKKDGTILNILLSSTPINIENQTCGITFTALDITERKRAEKELNKLSIAVQQSPAIIVITDLNGEIQYINPKFTEATGYQYDELKGQNVNVLESESMTEEKNKNLWDTISSGNVWHGEFQVKRKDRGTFWERASISPIRNDQDQIINYIKIAEDITEIRAKEQELKAALEKAKESDRLKSAFLSNMSHEIRTPMNGILGFTSLLQDPQLSLEEMDKYIQIIQKSGNRMLNTINDIVDISRIEAGQVEISNHHLSLNKLLDEQYAFFNREARLKNLTLNCKPARPDKDLQIVTDPYKLEGILCNLIKNAIKFTEKGDISFGYSLIDRPDFEGIEFYVKDSGIGIPADRIEAIFNRFEQADIEDSRVYEGSGLGLAISKSYVEMLGGNIWVTSQEQVGSTFYFTIPYINQSDKTIKTKTNKTPQKSAQNTSILIAEDDEASKLFFETILKDKFSKITYANTGNETVKKFLENPETTIILMDIKMPDMSGYEATREIRKHSNEVIIIAQTAFGLLGDREKAIESGCDEYITKPINKELLFQLINSCMDKKYH